MAAAALNTALNVCVGVRGKGSVQSIGGNMPSDDRADSIPVALHGVTPDTGHPPRRSPSTHSPSPLAARLPLLLLLLLPCSLTNHGAATTTAAAALAMEVRPPPMISPHSNAPVWLPGCAVVAVVVGELVERGSSHTGVERARHHACILLAIVRV